MRRSASARATRCAATELNPDSGNHRGRDQTGIGEGRELGEPHAVSKMRPQFACKRESQRCFPDTAGAGQRDEPMHGDEIQDLAQLLLPANQLGHRLWYVCRGRDRCGPRPDRADGFARARGLYMDGASELIATS